MYREETDGLVSIGMRVSDDKRGSSMFTQGCFSAGSYLSVEAKMLQPFSLDWNHSEATIFSLLSPQTSPEELPAASFSDPIPGCASTTIGKLSYSCCKQGGLAENGTDLKREIHLRCFVTMCSVKWDRLL
eukprot:1154520-Pelagomonas_calceolata.AAC.8